MDELAETELHEATAGLGNWHQVHDKQQYLVNKDECLSCLRDLQIALKNDAPSAGNAVRLKLGEWRVLANHLVPLFQAYREDQEICTTVLKLMVQLTTRVELSSADQLKHLEHLQDYKEAFAKRDVFIILMGMLVETMEEEENTEVRPNRKEVFENVLTLLRNLTSVPDPSPGDAGFTPLRRHLQLAYIRHFHDEGVLDFFLLFAETLAAEQNVEHAWALADILYHICAHVDPERLTGVRREHEKQVLADLITQEQADTRLRAPLASRHSRFGTSMQLRTAEGVVSVSTSVMQTTNVSKGRGLLRREFQDPRARNERKVNMFHDPFFVDLEEGSVRDHNQLNPHVRNTLDSAKNFSEAVLAGLSKFFVEFVPSCFSALVSLLRSTISSSASRASAGDRSLEFNRPKVLNLIAWFLEFHRHNYGAEASKAKQEGQPAPVIDIASIQGAIDLDMIQFVTARLREYGKDSNIHASHLVIVLRALAQQVKTISTVSESTDSETRDCGEILTQNIVKDDVMAHLAWIMKNFKSSTHDPRIMSYTVEAFHHILRLMGRLAEKHGQKLEFQVERSHGTRVIRGTTTTEKEVACLADARVVENLFHLLEKYKQLSPQLNSMLVKLIYQVIRTQPTNIVVFFELSYFIRIHRIWSDPIVRDKRSGKRYQEMVSLLQYVLRQFFKCAETNGCVFVELLFRKVQENPKEALLESHTSEFAAILDNYNDEDYKKLLERMKAGETLNSMRSRQRAALDGSLPWTDAEDQVLRDRYQMYADHPLCADLLAAELPEDSHRTARQVRKRLAELGLLGVRGGRPAQEAGQGAEDQAAGAGAGQDADDGGDDGDYSPPAKKQRKEDELLRSGLPEGAPSAQAADTQYDDEDTLEMDLERLLDAAMEVEGNTLLETGDSLPPATALDATASTAGDPDVEELCGPDPEGGLDAGGGLDLELELEAMMEAEAAAGLSIPGFS